MFQGSIVALVTPMHPDSTLDITAFKKLIDWHIAEKTAALVICGTTGEAATLTEEEQTLLIKTAVQHANERIPIIAGTGTNCTEKTIKLTENAMHAGATACLIVTPYYNKPTQHGLFLHYQTIAKKVPLPIILYNVPSRTACDMLPETVAKLAEISNIIGIKEASGKLERCQEILRICKEQLDVYSGEDVLACNWMLQGAKGVISVTANIAPRLMQEMCLAAIHGQTEQAKAIDQKLIALHKNLFVEANPIPVKWALAQMGLISTGIRLPLTFLDQRYHAVVKQALTVADIRPLA